MINFIEINSMLKGGYEHILIKFSIMGPVIGEYYIDSMYIFFYDK